MILAISPTAGTGSYAVLHAWLRGKFPRQGRQMGRTSWEIRQLDDQIVRILLVEDLEAETGETGSKGWTSKKVRQGANIEDRTLVEDGDIGRTPL